MRPITAFLELGVAIRASRVGGPGSRTSLLTVVWLGLLLGPSAAWGAVETYYFGLATQRTNITFESKTDFETILGSSHLLTGDVSFDTSAGVGAVVAEMPITSLKTGVDLRDQHLQGAMWLDAKKFPTLKFVSHEVKRSWKGKWKIQGSFTMHGVTRPVSAIVTLRSIPRALAKKAGLADTPWIKVTTTFRVSLQAHGIKVPAMAAAKVSDTIHIRLDVFASAKAPQGKTQARSAKLLRKALQPNGSRREIKRDRGASKRPQSGSGRERRPRGGSGRGY